MVNVASSSSSSHGASTRPNATAQTLARFRANPFALWSGYTALIGRNLPFTALQFPMFEHLRELIRKWRDRNGTRTGTLLESGLITAVSAGSAGSVSAFVTTPVDVVKTRIMLAAGQGEAENEQKHTKDAKPSRGRATTLKTSKDGLKDALGHVRHTRKQMSALAIGREILAKEGINGLFRGGALRSVWTLLGSGLYLGVYESGRVYLARRRGREIDEDEVF